MPSTSIRILALLCLAAAIMYATKYLVSNLLYASQSVNLNQDYAKQTYYKEKDVEYKKYPEVNWGGIFSPPNGTAEDKVAIIVPYRDRQEHLAIFLHYMHPFLMKQPIEYGMFIVEQEGTRPFNRGKLMNVGFLEAGDWPCFIFHDVDLLPLDQRNLYACSQQPRHMSAAIDTFNFTLPYEDIFGGVSALTQKQFKEVNGFSNRYWGWGGEDDDMSHRLKKKKYHITRYNMSIARYKMLNHKKLPSTPNPKRFALMLQTFTAFKEDGLSSVEYLLREKSRHNLYTRVLVNIDKHEKKLDKIRMSYYTNMLFGDKW